MSPTERAGHHGPHLDEDTQFELILELLSAAERENALRHVDACAECERQFRAMAAEWEHLTARVEMGELVVPEDAESPKRSTSGSVWSRLAAVLQQPRWRLAFAVAVIAVILAVVLPLRVGDPHHDLLRPLPSLSGEVQLRGSEAPEDRLLGAVDAYGRGDFELTVRELEAIELHGPADLYRQIYLGSALANRGEYERAVATLEAVSLERVPEPWVSEARWTLFVALRATGQIDKANAALDDLKMLSGPVGDRARALE